MARRPDIEAALSIAVCLYDRRARRNAHRRTTKDITVYSNGNVGWQTS